MTKPPLDGAGAAGIFYVRLPVAGCVLADGFTRFIERLSLG